MILSISKCDSCGKAHKNVVVNALVNLVKEDGKVWTHYAYCPTTSERILVRIVAETLLIDRKPSTGVDK